MPQRAPDDTDHLITRLRAVLDNVSVGVVAPPSTHTLPRVRWWRCADDGVCTGIAV